MPTTATTHAEFLVESARESDEWEEDGDGVGAGVGAGVGVGVGVGEGVGVGVGAGVGAGVGEGMEINGHVLAVNEDANDMLQPAHFMMSRKAWRVERVPSKEELKP